MSDIAFLVSAIVCVVSAGMIVSQRNPVYSVVYMLPFFLGMTMIFVLLQATFLAAIQMIVYGGAILVVFLFVIMLINLQPEELRDDFSLGGYALPALLAGMLAATVVICAWRGTAGSTSLEHAFFTPVDPRRGLVFGTAENLAWPMFTQFMVPFELASILIVVAILGAVLLSKKRI